MNNSDSNRFDVIIPYTPKDSATLTMCIQGIVDNVQNHKRIIVVSKEKPKDLHASAEWWNEQDGFPFTINDCWGRGWLYQQLLKLYALFCIKDITEQCLVVDSDVVFLRPISFYNFDTRTSYFTVGGGQEFVHFEYFDHMRRINPAFKQYLAASAIAHHMMFDRMVLQEMFSMAENATSNSRKEPFWNLFLNAIDKAFTSGGPAASEYELYANFMFAHFPAHCEFRLLTWKNSAYLDDAQPSESVKVKDKDKSNSNSSNSNSSNSDSSNSSNNNITYDMVALHAWMRPERLI